MNDFNNWEELGLHLRIKKTTLDRIRSDRRDIKPCRREMLSCWLRGDSDDLVGEPSVPTFDKLIQTLIEMDDKETAESIKIKLQKDI